MAGPIVHIGYSKAASSFLQDVVFPKLKTYRYAPLTREVQAWSDAMIHTGAAEGEDLAAEAGRLRAQIEAAAGAPASSDILVSYEGLSAPFAADGRPVAAKIAAVFGPDVRVLIIIRDQRAWLRSMFLQAVKQGVFSLRGGLTGFLKSPYWDKPPASLYEPYRRIDYATLIDSYVEHLGAENVMVLFYEQFTRDPRKAADQLKAALGLADEDIDYDDFRTDNRVNLTQTTGAEAALQVFGALLGSRYRARTLWAKLPGPLRKALSRFSGGPVRIPDEAQAIAMAGPVIADINRRLAGRGYDVAAYGYLV